MDDDTNENNYNDDDNNDNNYKNKNGSNNVINHHCTWNTFRIVTYLDITTNDVTESEMLQLTVLNSELGYLDVAKKGTLASILSKEDDANNML